MADPKTPITPATPAPVEGKINIAVPEGIDPAAFLKSIDSFVKATQRGKKVGKAITTALGQLKKAHKDEYYNLLVAAYKVEGLDPSSLRK